MRSLRWVWLGVLLAAALAAGADAHAVMVTRYTRSSAMVTARDGVQLHIVILRPEGSEVSGPPLPFLMERTPYGIDGVDTEGIQGSKPELVASGYIFVFCDIRGRYRSGGKFVMNRPIVPHRSSKDIDETTDTYDTIAWLLRNVPNNNGRVGVYGISYPGFLAMMAGINAHPAVKAISPQAPMTDVWMGDDFFHNGAFRQTYGFDYVQEMEAQKTDVRVDSRTDTFAQFLQEGNFANAARDAGMSSLPTARAFLEHPEYSRFWQAMAVERALHRVEVPTLEVGGTWDQEDMWGTQAQYAALHPLDTGHQVFLVLGPWNHGGWSGIGAGATLGPLQFGQATGDAYRRNVEAPFFEWYLKDRPGFDVRGVMSFRTGENRWQQYAAWPPQPRDAATRLYLTASHGVALQAPAGEGAVSYRADPAQPVPYLSRPIYSTYGSGSRWSTWMLEDQRFATSRADVAVFRSEVLDHDVTVTGDVTADLFAATTGSDADWVVKLMDVYPKDAPEPLPDYQLMIAGEIFRGRYVRSFEHPTPLVPGKVTEFRWSLHAVDHTFLKGHRIMVEVQSSWFPLYDRNPQTFVKNIMSAPAKAYRAQTQTIECSAQYPSHLELNVTPASLP